jgi:parallel beta-helix repeat protein
MKKSFSCLLLVAVLVSSIVGLTRANFFPPPTSLPHLYIRSDGSFEPTSSPIQKVGNVYTLTGNLTNRTLEIQCNNVVIDGAGYFLEGNGSGQGIVLKDVNGVVVRNLVVQNLREGIDVTTSLNCTIHQITVTGTEVGIYLYNSSENIVESNLLEGNSGDAIVLYNGCNYNSIFENQINQNGKGGISLQAPNMMLNQTTCDFNRIIGNNITSSVDYGICVVSSNRCLIQRNTIVSCEGGIQLLGSNCRNNTVIWSKISYCRSYGILLAGGVSGNLIGKNTLMGNRVGVEISASENNQFYNNNFINNYWQVVTHGVSVSSVSGVPSTPSVNLWDNGSATGGNYWSNHIGKDANNDGYVDDPYVVDANSTDRFPLMQTFGLVEGYTAPSPLPNESPTPSASENQSIPTLDPHSATTYSTEMAYALVAVVAIVVLGATIILRKRKSVDK